MCASNGCWNVAPKPPTSAPSKHWKTSTGSSIPPSVANRSSTWPPGNYCAKPRTCCSSDRPASAKRTLAQAIGYEAIKQGKEVLYRSIFDLVRDFLKDEAFNQQDTDAAPISQARSGHH